MKLTLTPVILESLQRLSVDDLEDDGSGTLSDHSSLNVDTSLSDAPELTSLPFVPDWGDSVASSDQVESMGEDEIKDFEF